MAQSVIAAQRLHNQQLVGSRFRAPSEVVSWLGAVQAQEYAGAKWSLSLRLPGISEEAIEQAFTEGAILRTHVMRPTWHFVAPADIRWMLELTAPRVNTINGHMYRKLELDEGLLGRANDIIARALEGGRQRTRAELGSALAQAGIAAEGMRLGYIVHHAELDRIICSGARRGRQFTYALLEERVPPTRQLERDEALAELARRYFTSHGPATIDDFAWWSGLTKADVRTGIQLVGSQLVHEKIEGMSYWIGESPQPVGEISLTAYLLPTYDEYIIGYADRSALFGASASDMKAFAGKLAFDSMIVVGGQIVGSWRRTLRRDVVVLERKLVIPLSDAEEQGLASAIGRFGAHLGRPVVLA